MCAMKPCLRLESLKPGTARSAGQLLTYSATRASKRSSRVEFEVVVCQRLSCETDWWSGKGVCLDGGEGGQTAGYSGMKSWSGAMSLVLLLIFYSPYFEDKE